MQSDDTVATVGGTARDSVCRGVGAGGVGMPVPGVAAAGGDGLHALFRLAGSHNDGDTSGCAGATVGGASDGIGGGAGGRHGNGTGVTVVGPGVAGSAVGGERGAFVERYGSVTRYGHQRDGLDGEVQSVHLCATVHVRVGVEIGAALGVGLPVAGTPGVAAAFGNGNGIMCRFMDGEVQGDNTVATVGGPAGDGVGGSVGAGSIGVPVPSVAAAGSYGLDTLRGYALFNVDGDADGLTCAQVVVPRDGVGGCRCWIGYETRGTQPIAPNVGFGTRGHNGGALVEEYVGVAGYGHHRDGRDGEVQGVNLSAAIGAGILVSVGARGGVCGPIPGVTAALINVDRVVC